MDLPVVSSVLQRRPSLKSEAINKLIQESYGDEQALYVLEAATGLRISEALALEKQHLLNDCRTIQVIQQVDRKKPKVVTSLKTYAGKREIDVPESVAGYLRQFAKDKKGLLFPTKNGTPHLAAILKNVGLLLAL